MIQLGLNIAEPEVHEQCAPGRQKARRTTSGCSSSGSTTGDSAAKTWNESTSGDSLLAADEDPAPRIARSDLLAVQQLRVFSNQCLEFVLGREWLFLQRLKPSPFRSGVYGGLSSNGTEMYAKGVDRYLPEMRLRRIQE